MPVYSHSRINSFENCPLQYRFRYIDRIKREVQSIEAFMGKLVHEVLEMLFLDLDRARAATPEDYGEIFSDLWRRNLTPEVRIVRDNMKAEDYHAVGRRCVESFFRRHHPFSRTVAGTEIKVEFSLDREGRYRMRGFVDRIDRPADGILEIHDYKTGTLPRRGALERDRQLTLYEIALRERWPDVHEVRQVWHYLAHDREFTISRTSDDLHRTRVSTIKAIQCIEATTDFPARRSPLCSWCEYKDICPEWAGERAEASPARPAEDPPQAAPPGGRGQGLLF